MMKNGIQSSINTKYQCITLMKEYDKKSLEVLLSKFLTFERCAITIRPDLTGYTPTLSMFISMDEIGNP